MMFFLQSIACWEGQTQRSDADSACLVTPRDRAAASPVGIQAKVPGQTFRLRFKCLPGGVS